MIQPKASRRSSGTLVAFAVMAMTAVCLLAPPAADAVERPQWPTVGAVTSCNYQWDNGGSGSSYVTFVSLNGSPDQILRRGRLRTQLIDGGGADQGAPFTVDIDLAYKPDETQQHPLGTTLELTVPNQVQCKEFSVIKVESALGCFEGHLYGDCSNGVSQSCVTPSSCP